MASLDQNEKVLRLEDVWQLSGVPLRDKPFTARWEMLLDFYSCQYKADTFLQQGLSIVPAKYQALEAIQQWPEVPAVMIAQGEVGGRRLEVHFQAPAGPPSQQQQSQQQHKQKERKQLPMFVEEVDVEESSGVQESHDGSEVVAKAVAREDLPDTYELWIGGVKKGYGAVQDLDLSTQLRQAAKQSKSFAVKVVWNEEFGMFEISSLLSAE